MAKRSAFRRSIAFLSLSACLSSAHAVELGDHFSLSGFGTLAALRTDTDDAGYIRESQSKGATDSPSFGTDSNFGLQLNVKANDWLSATVQAVSKRRADVYEPTQIEWAFVKVEPINGLSLRGGRMALPTFAISDSRNVGYSNAWIHAPNEVYGIALLNQLDGFDATYAHDLGEGKLKLSAYGGTSEFTKVEMKDVRGVNLSWENDWLNLRVGRLQGHPEFPPALGMPEDTYKFQGVGAIVNRGNLLLQAEYVQRRSLAAPEMVNADAWYVLGGYRFGQFQPFVSYSKLDPEGAGAARQNTKSLGVRWDFHRSLALKAQWDIVDTHGTRGVSFNQVEPDFDGKVNVIALALDFVF